MTKDELYALMADKESDLGKTGRDAVTAALLLYERAKAESCRHQYENERLVMDLLKMSSHIWKLSNDLRKALQK